MCVLGLSPGINLLAGIFSRRASIPVNTSTSPITLTILGSCLLIPPLLSVPLSSSDCPLSVLNIYSCTYINSYRNYDPVSACSFSHVHPHCPNTSPKCFHCYTAIQAFFSLQCYVPKKRWLILLVNPYSFILTLRTSPGFHCQAQFWHIIFLIKKNKIIRLQETVNMDINIQNIYHRGYFRNLL